MLEKIQARPFQIIVLAIFAVLALIGLLVFAGAGPNNDRAAVGAVVIWGVLPQEEVRGVLREYGDAFQEVTYREVPLLEFHNTYTQALAVGRGPDVVLITHELLRTSHETLIPIPFEVYSARAYQENFIDGSIVLRAPNGYHGLPVGVDPLMLFYNRTLLNTAGIAQPPVHWEQFFGLAPRLTVRGPNFSLSQSMVALGSYENITHARRVLSALFLQSGTPIANEAWNIVLDARVGTRAAVAESALRFFAEFADPNKVAYSWNASLSSDRQQFLEGKLAFYFAPASDGRRLQSANPNLPLGFAPFPQMQTANERIVYGDFYFASVVRMTRNAPGAQAVVLALGDAYLASRLATATNITPVRRELLSAPAADPLRDIAFSSALVSRAWVSPQPARTNSVFSAMVGDVVNGRRTVQEAIEFAARGLRQN